MRLQGEPGDEDPGRAWDSDQPQSIPLLSRLVNAHGVLHYKKQKSFEILCRALPPVRLQLHGLPGVTTCDQISQVFPPLCLHGGAGNGGYSLHKSQSVH